MAAMLLSLAAVLAACAAGPETVDNQPMTDHPAGDFTVIAHRGASGYLPEHTLAAAAMAHAMEADYIEQDVVMSRDGELVVLHDLTLGAVTDVAARFPGRQRADGQYYAIDFDLAEIRTLRVRERREPDGKPVFPGRFDAAGVDFRVPTLREEIALIQGLNRSTGRDVGVYVEPKSPAWHRAEGRDLLAAVVGVLAEFGYEGRDDKAFLQSFDFNSLHELRFGMGSDLKLIQLIGENSWGESSSDFDYLRSAEGLAEIAAFADGIGPWLPQVIHVRGVDAGQPTGLVAAAHRRGLLVHAYTLRADQLPDTIPALETAVDLLVNRARLDGVFTDHPDRVIRALRAGKTGASPE
jgi:glycerophosphoryl diester phosphodiesterase